MRLRFCGYMDYEEGKLARVETLESEIPVNIHAEDDSDTTLYEGDDCVVNIYAVGNHFELYHTEAEYKAAGKRMAAMSMIPSGTFPANENDEDFRQSANIIYTGKILDVWKEREATENINEPNYCLEVQTYELRFLLYVWYDGTIERGTLISGVAWLFGTVQKTE